MKTKDITPSQYAKWYKCSLSNVTKQIRKEKELLHVVSVKKWGRFYLLEVPTTLNASSFKSKTKKI